MTKAWTDSALVTTPFSVRPSSPHEKETEPDGKKLSPNCKSAMAAATSLITRHLDLTRPQQRFEAREVVFGRSLHRDKDSAKLEPHSPMMVSGAIARLERGIGIPRLDT